MNAEAMSNLFKQCSAIARAGALDALKARAIQEHTIIVTCSWCDGFIREYKDAQVSGISHSCCAECFKGLEAQKV